MRKNVVKIGSCFILAICMMIAFSGKSVEAKTVKNYHNCAAIQYGTSYGKPYARSYYNRGWISPHWASVRIRETGNYVCKDTPYKGWTPKATVRPGTWWTYHYSVNCGLGYKSGTYIYR